MTAAILSEPGRRARATAIGGSAILMWSALAPLAALNPAIPPFELIALAFALAFLVGVVAARLRGKDPLRPLRQPPVVWFIGVVGLFGYHSLYFLALKTAPPLEASLINYLWPLLIVLFSALLPGDRLGWRHIAGALAGFLGTVLVIGRGWSMAADSAAALGYVAALASAVIWAGYSVISRHLATVPTEAIGGFCLGTALLALLCHLMFEVTRWPTGVLGCLAVAALGLGPVGGAFFVWDYGVKHGDIRLLGTLAYAAPVLSTLLLVMLGVGQASWTVWPACALVVGGAALAASGRAVA